jgi:thiol-disulfide isomerase/thioredoxin
MNLDNITIILIIAVAVLGIGVVYLFLNMGKKENYSSAGDKERPQGPPQQMPPSPSPQGGQDEGSKPTLILLHSLGCPHCRDMMGEWEKLKQAISHKILVREIESAEPAMKQFQVRGFPTIRFYPHGLKNPEFADYKGPRTAEAIVQFIFGPPPSPQNGGGPQQPGPRHG